MNNFVIVSEIINRKFEKELTKCGLIVVKVRKNKKLYTAIESHPDIVLCNVEKDILIESDSYKYLSSELERFDYNLIQTQAIENGKYPGNIKLNLAYTSKFAIHNFKHTDEKLLKTIDELLEANKIVKINTRQGYSKCSILIIDYNSIITSDAGVYECVKDQMNCLLISKGHIRLNTLEYGFIGGASGRYKNEIWFYGDISKHPDYKNIKSFIENRNLKLKYFEEFELEDIGSILFFEND